MQKNISSIRKKIDAEQFGSIYYEKSIKYIGTEQLLELGFMKICPEYGGK